MATGLISAPVDPKFEGLETFAGEQYMTSRWPQTEPAFAGKRVAVIGTGSSGIQVISEVAKDAGRPTFCSGRRLVPCKITPWTASRFQNSRKIILRERVAVRLVCGFYPCAFRAGTTAISIGTWVSEEERRAEYENRWASGGLSPYYAYTDSLLDDESNETLAAFAREKIQERVDDPELAEKLCPDYQILTRRLSPETDTLGL